MLRSKAYRDSLRAARIREIGGPEIVRTKAIAALQAGAKPPWGHEHEEIFLTSWMVRERLCQELMESGENGGRMYVLGFQGLDTAVKVGSSGSPEKRIKEYEVQGQNWGLGLVDGWVSAPVGTRSRAYTLESVMLQELHIVLNGHVLGGRTFEWFHGHDFERIKALVQDPDKLFEEFLFGRA
ncbi:hypothetical protein [Streptomyces sp. TE33382]